MQVALPWGLPHYARAGGFARAWRALVEDAPASVGVRAWETASLANVLAGDAAVRDRLGSVTRRLEAAIRATYGADEGHPWIASFGEGGLALTALLPGDVELHHDLLAPSLSRPFVFLCADLAWLSAPLAPKLAVHSLCKGIVCTRQATADELLRRLSGSGTAARIVHAPLGVRVHGAPLAESLAVSSLAAPRFVFMAGDRDESLARDHAQALRLWTRLRARGIEGRLRMLARRPDDAVLRESELDVDFIRAEENRGLSWIDPSLPAREIAALVADAQFMLAPGDENVIALGMALGSLPVVSEAVGGADLIEDGVTGIVFRADDDADARIAAILANPDAYLALRRRSMTCGAGSVADVTAVARFWEVIERLASTPVDPSSPMPERMADLERCTLSARAVTPLFDAPRRPTECISLPTGRVFAVGGSYVHTLGGPEPATANLSPLVADTGRTTFGPTIASLEGRYLRGDGEPLPRHRLRPAREAVARALAPMPRLYGAARGVLRAGRKLAERFR